LVGVKQVFVDLYFAGGFIETDRVKVMAVRRGGRQPNDAVQDDGRAPAAMWYRRLPDHVVRNAPPERQQFRMHARPSTNAAVLIGAAEFRPIGQSGSGDGGDEQEAE